MATGLAEDDWEAAIAADSTLVNQGDLLARLTESEWLANEKLVNALREPLLSVAANYLCRVKRGNGRAYDPVADFHLSNGAAVGQLNWQADISQKGLAQSFGIMVNFVYKRSRIEGNSTAYLKESDVKRARGITELLKVKTLSKFLARRKAIGFIGAFLTDRSNSFLLKSYPYTQKMERYK